MGIFEDKEFRTGCLGTMLFWAVVVLGILHNYFREISLEDFRDGKIAFRHQEQQQRQGNHGLRTAAYPRERRDFAW